MAAAGTAPFGPEKQPGHPKMRSASQPGTLESAAGLARLVLVTSDAKNSAGASPVDRQHFSRWCSEQLELGNILFLSAIPFGFPDEWREFLLRLRIPESRHHKNIAFRPREDRLTGFTSEDKDEQKLLHSILRNYSARVAKYLSVLLPNYLPSWRLDYASFRPFEEQGRHLRLRARNDLLHTDAFPTRPTNGDRILRFFTNLNRESSRVWLTGPAFDTLAEQYACQAGLSVFKRGLPGTLEWLSRRGRKIARVLRLPGAARSRYDRFMLRFHHFLKEKEEFQLFCPKSRHEFPPGSCWMAFTDMVSHAVLSGQFALEQSFLVSRNALVLPEQAPLRVLERLSGRSLLV